MCTSHTLLRRPFRGLMGGVVLRGQLVEFARGRLTLEPSSVRGVSYALQDRTEEKMRSMISLRHRQSLHAQ